MNDELSRSVPTIALLGQPNSGKSTLFNGLTGSRQHVGNWPGKTVEKKEGTAEHNGLHYHITDLPGSYSLSAHSDEEMITRDYIASGDADVVCIIADASQLDRSLYILADYIGIDCPAILLLNLMDVAASCKLSVSHCAFCF
jgi:ferrous iron transport protein B